MLKVDRNTFRPYTENTDVSLLKWTELGRRELLQTPILDVYAIKRKSTDGRQGEFTVLESKNWSNVIPVFTGSDGRKYFVMERQFRHGSGTVVNEFPGGIIEDSEQPEVAAVRELQEETGILAHKITELGNINPNSAFIHSRGHIFLAEDLEYTGKTNFDPNEQIEVFTISEDELIERLGTEGFDNGSLLISMSFYLKKNSRSEVATRTLIHEIKNPLTAINIQCEILKDETSDCKSDIELIEKQTEHILRLTEQYTQLLTDTIGNPQQIELQPFLEDVIKSFKTEIKTDFADSDSALLVYFDKVRLRSILENLIKNSLESNPDKDPDVELKTESAQDSVTIKISDRGTGISAEVRQKLFTPFFTTKENGTGIGLSLAKRFAEAGGGSLFLSNREGGGTVAELVLPIERKA